MRVVLSGGGTGGHIYPAVAIARQCQTEHPDTQILYIGTTKGLESTLIPKENIPFEAIEITGFRRKLSMENVKTVVRFLKGVSRSKKILKEFKPDVVIGTGGYVCGPVVYAASKLGIPTMIHEQNAIPGLTNNFLSRYADTVALSFKESQNQFKQAKHVLFTGNPRATAVYHADRKKGYASLGIPEGSRIVLIVGGSRGAKAINEAMMGMASHLTRLPDVYFVYVTGESYYANTLEKIQQTVNPMPKRLQILPYLHNMPDVLAATSLVIGRSGASSLAEMTSLGIPSILIPSPNVTNNHQEANARSLERANAAEVILERELEGSKLFALVENIMNDHARWDKMSEAARTLGQPDSAERIVQEMIRLTEQNR
ncbi:undecaprenyldiphospho-muramoylpentapeptide beta-N-acetylglucosaminyltransferase [Paenibacillus selenitireducens]|uniref:UDP-N-acetylglucosamine--N-acetylmuramyl-(pentapeptide) pyrophosphoryl-undecaprenol N-acetylglucosamine transferase n=1 Tax=Paenibacillus selenitireducens TaxID=1324314 RepID=A0A1T2XFK6_9BACL|nr:undecaprenyldiphospho-muramoylpentapeptide beta-N-acetylglucosaminyltransferase [Paenibacillus selenitireducens]OPA78466.1 undecaprenyldiphospho-muramoylpentapeptide beta-N-acetylglucosaminyltransferase [Paenibacillus selenitireducens]